LFPAATPPPTMDDAAPAAAVELEAPDNSSVGKELPTSVDREQRGTSLCVQKLGNGWGNDSRFPEADRMDSLVSGFIHQ